MGDYTPIKNLVERCREHMDKVAEKTVMLTYEGLKKYQDELQELKVNRRQEVAQKIKEAREQGDLSENAEYDAAKDEQRDIEARIEELEKILKNAEVVVEEEAVYIGTNVEYAPYVEFGTRRMDPQPYLFPAVENHIDEYKNMAEAFLKGE